MQNKETEKAQLAKQLTYHCPSPEQAKTYERMNEMFIGMGENIIDACDDSLVRQQAIFALYQCRMFVHQAITFDDQQLH